MSKITTFIFDFDGVTANTELVFSHFDCALLNAYLEKTGNKPTLTPADVRQLAGRKGGEKLIVVGETIGIDMQPYLEAYEEERNEKRKTLFIEHKVPLGKNIREFINTVGKKHCALATNKSEGKLENDLKIMGIADLYDIKVTTEPLPRKPSPDIIIEAMRLMDATPEESAYIGDNKNDMIAAKAAGVTPIGFTIDGLKNEQERAEMLREHGAVVVIDDHMDLLSCMKQDE